MTVVFEPNPTVARRELAVFFHEVRELRKRSLEELGTHLDVAASQASRLDTGARGFRPEDVRKLSAWYGLDQETEERLLALADESKKRAWWQQVDLPNSYRTLIGMEKAAVSISEYCGNVMPGLLQTRDYAQAAIAAGAADVTVQRVQLTADVRIRRQQILEGESAPRLRVVIDEVALARGVKPPEVMRRQLEYLLEVGKRPNVEVQVIGFEYGIHPGPDGHFMLIGLGRSIPDVIYREDKLTFQDSSDARELARIRDLWDSLRAIALSPRESAERIQQYADRLSAPLRPSIGDGAGPFLKGTL